MTKYIGSQNQLLREHERAILSQKARCAALGDSQSCKLHSSKRDKSLISLGMKIGSQQGFSKGDLPKQRGLHVSPAKEPCSRQIETPNKGRLDGVLPSSSSLSIGHELQTMDGQGTLTQNSQLPWQRKMLHSFHVLSLNITGEDYMYIILLLNFLKLSVCIIAENFLKLQNQFNLNL